MQDNKLEQETVFKIRRLLKQHANMCSRKKGGSVNIDDIDKQVMQKIMEVLQEHAEREKVKGANS